MSVTIETDAHKVGRLSDDLHRHCIVCGVANRSGLRLEFVSCSDGSVMTIFPCSSLYQGYSGILHGGIISCLLDGAMTNCLFANDITATTGELNIRYLHPVRVGCPAVIRAKIDRSRPPLHIVQAELTQENKLQVRATAKFMDSGPERPEST